MATENHSQYEVYPERWWTLAMFSCLNASNSQLWITFAPISDITSDYFGGIGITAVNMLALVFQIVYVPGTVLGVYTMKEYGMRGTMLIGGSLSFVGAVIRVIGALLKSSIGNWGAYSLIMIGQIVGALGQPLYTNLPSAIAASWFQVRTHCGQSLGILCCNGARLH